MLFHEKIKELRLQKKMTLRDFCHTNGLDPSNWSKFERGVNPPPKSRETLENWAKQLGCNPGTEEWDAFMFSAEVARGQIPKELMSEPEIVDALPSFFRTIRGMEMTKERFEKLVKMVKEAHLPDEA